jgi:hypothetical protein
MANRPIRYYFGRLNLIANYTDKRDFLLIGLRTSKYVEHRGYKWGFFEASELQSEFGLFLHGYFVKYRPETDEEVAVPETHKLSDEAIANRVIAKSRFFLHVESGLIAYHPVGNQIENQTFCDRFVQLFQEAFDNLFVNAEIQVIEEQFKIFDAIKKFKSISKVFVYLHPSNPSNSDRWERIDKRLKKLGASSFHEQYDGKPDGKGLDIVEDEELTSKIFMADDGYGKADVTGEMNGEVRIVSTKDNPITALAPNDEEPPENVITKLSTAIRKIFSRFVA